MKAKYLLGNVLAFACVFALGTITALGQNPTADDPPRLQPVGQAKGIHPGRVVWVHDSKVLDWKGPGDGHWWESKHIDQARVDAMMDQAVCKLTGEPTVTAAWDKLFRYQNQTRGKGNVGYKKGEKIMIKPNWVGLIWREGHVNEETYDFKDRQDYMNTSPQMIVALMKQLVAVGVAQEDITVCDTLSYFVNEFYNVIHGAFPKARYEDFAGKFGRVKVHESDQSIYWSCRPQGKTIDYLPTCVAEAEYLVNFAQLKAHTATGVTLCGKNHFGSLVRWPVQQGYYDMHSQSFMKAVHVYREQVDLMGHAQLGGKTVLYLIDGLLSGKHPVDPAPRKWTSEPFGDYWTCSLLASQDPVAIDSVGFDFLWAEYSDFPHQLGADDYLNEAAQADNPPSGTFYDPDHETPTKRLPSLGVHEHWNNAHDKKYSRNLGKDNGIELIAVGPDASK